MTEENQNCLHILLAAQAGLIPALAPAEATHKRVLANIMQQIAMPVMQVVRQNEGNWLDILPGVSIKILREDTLDNSQTTLWRLQPGAVVPKHQHSQYEECLVLEGAIVHAGIQYIAGDYLLSPRGMPHENFTTPTGALFLIRGEILDKTMML